MDIAFKVCGFSLTKMCQNISVPLCATLFMALRSHKTHAERSQNCCLNIMIALLSISDLMLHFQMHSIFWLVEFSPIFLWHLSIVALQIHTISKRKWSQLVMEIITMWMLAMENRKRSRSTIPSVWCNYLTQISNGTVDACCLHCASVLIN